MLIKEKFWWSLAAIFGKGYHQKLNTAKPWMVVEWNRRDLLLESVFELLWLVVFPSYSVLIEPVGTCSQMTWERNVLSLFLKVPFGFQLSKSPSLSKELRDSCPLRLFPLENVLDPDLKYLLWTWSACILKGSQLEARHLTAGTFFWRMKSSFKGKGAELSKAPAQRTWRVFVQLP